LTPPADPGTHGEVRSRGDLDSVPGDRFDQILGLLSEVEALNDASSTIRHRLEETTGLRVGELQTLRAVAAGAEHPRAVAHATGQVNEAAVATIDSLVRRGLLGRHHHRASPRRRSRPGLLHVTDPGQVVLHQVEGIQIHILEALLMALGDRETNELRSDLRTLTSALRSGGHSTIEIDRAG